MSIFFRYILVAVHTARAQGPGSELNFWRARAQNPPLIEFSAAPVLYDITQVTPPDVRLWATIISEAMTTFNSANGVPRDMMWGQWIRCGFHDHKSGSMENQAATATRRPAFKKSHPGRRSTVGAQCLSSAGLQGSFVARTGHDRPKRTQNSTRARYVCYPPGRIHLRRQMIMERFGRWETQHRAYHG